jgi:hypothetical protein
MIELLWSRAIVEALFAGLEVLELLEGTVSLDEGPRHQGPAEVVRNQHRTPEPIHTGIRGFQGLRAASAGHAPH